MKTQLPILGPVLVLSALIVGSCGPATAQPAVVPEVVVEPSISPLPEGGYIAPTTAPAEVAQEPPDPARARDMALAYVIERYGGQAPALGLTWTEERTTPEGLVGSSALQYTADAWVVTVSFPVVAPEDVVYQIVVANPATRFRWEGKIDAAGQVEVIRVETPEESPAQTPSPMEGGTAPIVDWAGVIVSHPPGSQFDDYFEWQSATGGRYGIDSLDEEIRQQIVALRDTGTTVRVWGTLHRDVPDVAGRQIQVARLEVQEPQTPPETTAGTVDGWVGTVVKLPPGNQFGRYFRRDDGERFDIGSTDDVLRQRINEVQWTGAQIQVWGELFTGVPATEARHIEVERLEVLSGPAEEARNLTPFATTSASSHLPTDRGGQYQSWMATDGALETSWVEGVAGPGIGEWIELRFPGTIEVHSIGVDVGYDRDADIFAQNNRIKKATLIFSDGETVELGFADQRGMQTIPLVRAPGPNIETTYVKVVIEEVFPGSRYDDTCLAEIEVWGRAR
jgi:hypothetical protein